MTIKVLMHMRKFSHGPRIFRDRIAYALSQIPDIEVVGTPAERFDIELSFIRVLNKHKKPRILRLDGCYYKRSDKHRNQHLIEGIKDSNFIIYQSHFSQRMFRKLLGVNEPFEIIRNGIDLDSIRKIDPDPTIPAGSFVACASWRANKRPMSTINGFVAAKTGRQLYMIGDQENVNKQIRRSIRHHDVIFTGQKSFEQTIAIMKSCQYMLHLCHVDSCPNAVIEGLVCGLNVLCTNLGGTSELVRDDGLMFKPDKWDFKYHSFTDIDSIDPALTSEYIHKLMEKTTRPVRKDLDIKHTARKYANVIKEVFARCH